MEIKYCVLVKMEDICIEQLIDESMQKIHPIGTTQKNPDFSAIVIIVFKNKIKIYFLIRNWY